jgi:hypothetical protein
MLNPFFQQGSKTEQSLIQDLINEQLRMYGVEIYYIPRKYITKKTIISEVIQSEFDNAYPIEAYVENYEGYGGVGTLLSKFGIQELDDLTLIISKERFETYITPLIENLPNVELATRPKEGDLIYFPLGDKLFEIKYVEHEKPFYQLQKNYVYELRCELFRYEDEVIDTGVDEIDDNTIGVDQGGIGYTQTLTLVGSGVTATAITSLVNGGVRFVTISDRGEGYTSVPTVAFSSAPFGGTTAVGIATLIDNIIDCNGKTSSKVQAVYITNPGFGYTVPPAVSFIGGGGVGVSATTTIGNGVVGIITITDAGSGYIDPPTVTFSGAPGAGITATAIANVSTASTINAIYVTNSGLGYTETPTITISSPYMFGSGNFIFNEIITGSTSGTTARVKVWNSVLNTLEVSVVSGVFLKDETVEGQDSGAIYKIRSINTDDLDDKFAQNDEIELEADAIIDFSERNPFGMP